MRYYLLVALLTTLCCIDNVSSLPSVLPRNRQCRPLEPNQEARTVALSLSQKDKSLEDGVSRPDPSILLSAQGDVQQKLGVIGIGVGLLGATWLATNSLLWLDAISGGLIKSILLFTTPFGLGLVFTALGVTHFIYKNEYAAIVPPPGTWGGLWNVPSPGADRLGLSYADYHVYWTGVAEVGGGLLLLLGGLHTIPVQIPALLLFGLTLAVTPANIYMFTHDAPLTLGPPLQYPNDHVVRAILQVVILSQLGYLVIA